MGTRFSWARASVCVAILLGMWTVTMVGNLSAHEKLKYEPGVILIEFEKGKVSLPRGKEEVTIENIVSDEAKHILQRSGFKRGTKIFPDAIAGETRRISRTGEWVRVKDLSRYLRLEFDRGTDLKALIDSLRNVPGLSYVGVNRTFRPLGIFPNDPYFNLFDRQWGLHNVGEPGKDIHAADAWTLSTGGDVRIAVIDGGVDYNHVDLDPGNRTRVISGWDFGNDDSDPMDDLSGGWAGHGTFVAGVLGAITNNGQGIAGVIWDCEILPVKVAGPVSIGPFEWGEYAFEDDIADGISYAVNNGADVINMSFGGEESSWTGLIFGENPILSASHNAFLNDVVLVAGMGNDDSDTPFAPARYPFTIAVGASNEQDVRITLSNTNDNWGSNYGDYIDVVAPGIRHYSTERNNAYDYFSGTSCAAPFVSVICF